jgi:hypothetical protein
MQANYVEASILLESVYDWPVLQSLFRAECRVPCSGSAEGAGFAVIDVAANDGVARLVPGVSGAAVARS